MCQSGTFSSEGPTRLKSPLGSDANGQAALCIGLIHCRAHFPVIDKPGDPFASHIFVRRRSHPHPEFTAPTFLVCPPTRVAELCRNVPPSPAYRLLSFLSRLPRWATEKFGPRKGAARRVNKRCGYDFTPPRGGVCRVFTLLSDPPRLEYAAHAPQGAIGTSIPRMGGQWRIALAMFRTTALQEISGIGTACRILRFALSRDEMSSPVVPR
jgi:hypothetical protein